MECVINKISFNAKKAALDIDAKFNDTEMHDLIDCARSGEVLKMKITRYKGLDNYTELEEPTEIIV